jgi:transposase
LLGEAEPILIAGGRAVAHSTEIFVGIDVSKGRNAVAVADGERGGEVRFVGEVDASEESRDRLKGGRATRFVL